MSAGRRQIGEAVGSFKATIQRAGQAVTMRGTGELLGDISVSFDGDRTAAVEGGGAWEFCVA